MTSSSIQPPLLLAIALCLGSSCPASATTIYATDAMHTIYAIDPDAQTITTLLVTTLAPVAVAPGPSPGSVFYIAPPNPQNGPDDLWLYEAGTSTLISRDVFQLMLGEGRDGYWYFAPQPGTPPPYHELARVDAAGVVTFIGGGPYRYAGDVAADCAGELFGTVFEFDSVSHNYLVKIDKSTGVQTVVGDMGVAGYPQGQFYGMAFSDDGRLWTTDPGTPATLYTVDPTTGATTPIMQLPFGPGDLGSESDSPCGPTGTHGTTLGGLKVKYR